MRSARTRRSTARRAATLRTYSHTGSRGLPWKRPIAAAVPRRLQRREPVAQARASMTSCVQRAASAAPGENSSQRQRRRSPPRSWLPARQTSACSRDEAHAVVGVGAVADEVAEAPDLARRGRARRRASTASRAWRLPWMSERTATCMARTGGCDGSVRPCGAPCVAASVAVARRARRGAGRGAAAAPARRRHRARRRSTSDRTSRDAQLERAVDFRAAAARAVRRDARGRRPACSSCSSPAAARSRARLRGPFRRPVLVGGGGRRGALGRCSTLAALPIDARHAPARDRRRPRRPGRGRAGAGDVARSAAIGAVLAGVGDGAPRSRSCAACRGAGGSRRPGSSSLIGAGVRVRRARSSWTRSSTASQRLPDGPVRAPRCWSSRGAPDVDVGEVYVVDACTPHDGRQRLRHRARAHRSASSSTTRCWSDFPPRRDAPRRRPRARARALPRRAARAALPRARRAARACSRRAASRGAWAPGRRPAAPGPSSVPALFASVALVVVPRSAPSSQPALAARRGARRQLRAAADRRRAGPFLAQQRRLALRNVSDPDPPALARRAARHAPDDASSGSGIGLAYERGGARG